MERGEERLAVGRMRVGRAGLVLDNGLVRLVVGGTGEVVGLTRGGRDVKLQQQFAYYEGAVGDNERFEDRASGAYIFRWIP